MSKDIRKPAPNETKGLVPELRFPEFVEDGEWIDSTIEEISSISSGGTPSRSKPQYWNGEIPWVSTTLINYNKIRTANEFITELGLKNSSTKMFPKGTILMAMYGQGKTRGKVAVLDIKAAINQACAAISLKKGMNIEFVFQNLSARYEEIRKISNEGGQKNLSSTLIKKIPFIYPRIESEEQQKIANCLSSLDHLITAETDKLDQLKNHKKGLLQQLFPANGETKPLVRFPEFVGDGEWEEKELSVALDGKSSQIAKNKLEIVDDGFPIYGADGLIGCINSFTQKEDYIAIVKDGSGVGNLFYYEGKSSLLGTLTYLISKNEKNYKIKWLYYLLHTVSFNPFVKGSGIPHIYYKDYSKLLVLIPKDPEEQQKITNCLSSADDLITAQTTKIEALKTHKKGLMQQLFPNINELAI
ncbi:hypothetical protein BZG02_02880 [Labilibaculum filiforme]|uniref:Type I restriction modification DNA specificity domain-containing protein n=1 Tax=Labilibaculum filiforme TaxID=1940526 RepID=A0A2N3I3D1_9BACT|nr:restriction endonuclease subunit S [Labilibaculum filiforme]PKQ64812.1 hypothetical protein BZG02_02880 [Labilibaculum filiforme]